MHVAIMLDTCLMQSFAESCGQSSAFTYLSWLVQLEVVQLERLCSIIRAWQEASSQHMKDAPGVPVPGLAKSWATARDELPEHNAEAVDVGLELAPANQDKRNVCYN